MKLYNLLKRRNLNGLDEVSFVVVAGGLVEDLKVPVEESLEPAFACLEVGIIRKPPCHHLDLSS